MVEIIRKSCSPSGRTPNLVDYELTCEKFTWESVRNELSGLPGGQGLNIAHEAVDRHAQGSQGERIALRWLSREGRIEVISYRELRAHTNRFANVLRRLGVGKGDRVFALSHRVPALYVTALGTLKNGSVFCPLFAAFGPEPIYQRLSRGDAKVLVTGRRLFERKVRPLLPRLPALEHVVLTDIDEGKEEALSFDQELAASSAEFEIPPTDPEDMALIHFTSGTTGMPKGAVHVHEAVLTHYVTGKYALDLHPEDVFWCTADPGWVTGTSYGIIAPLLHGVTNLVDEADFDAKRWYRILEEHEVNVWYTAPTAIRMLMRLPGRPADEHDLSALRFVASVGEPLNPEAVVWGQEALGLPIHDNWWQTETGGIMIANYAATEIRPGSMGRPLPGVEATILRRDASGNVLTDDDGNPVEEDQPLTEGELALKPGWPSMFRGYLEMEDRYRKAFVGDWYRSGDLAERDEDGFFWFVGRADDVIKSAGHLIGPFEVESVLVEHPAVAEAGVIGVPDEVAGEIVKAFVSLNPGYEWAPELEKELMGFARKRLGASVAPREIDHEPDLPHTRSGKIMRRLLRAWELGLPTGDLSTLEGEDND